MPGVPGSLKLQLVSLLYSSVRERGARYCSGSKSLRGKSTSFCDFTQRLLRNWNLFKWIICKRNREVETFHTTVYEHEMYNRYINALRSPGKATPICTFEIRKRIIASRVLIIVFMATRELGYKNYVV